MTETVEAVDVAIGVLYVVKVDKEALGMFTSCEGLGAEVVLETREEGGNNAFVWQLPTRVKYPNVKFTRPISKSTSKIADWFAKVANGLEPTTAEITAMSSNGTTIATWTLQGVVPVRWTGPSLTPDNAKVVTETVEIAHHGFAPAQGK